MQWKCDVLIIWYWALALWAVLELWVNTRSVLYRGIQILSIPWHMISAEFVSFVILSAGTWLDRANLLVDMCDLFMFFLLKYSEGPHFRGTESLLLNFHRMRVTITFP
jgi:hypothetical protein